MLKINLIVLALLLIQINTQLFGNEVACTESDHFVQEKPLTTEELNIILNQLDKKIEEITNERDTTCLIQLHKHYANLGGSLGNYSLVFDALWKALLLADQAGMQEELFTINIDIGIYYGYLKRYEKAKERFKIAATLKKEFLKTNNFDPIKANKFYAPQVAMYGRTGDFDQAKLYLDSCYQYINQKDFPRQFHHLEFNRATHLAHDGQHEKALEIFYQVADKLKVDIPAFQGVIYKHIGDSYRSLAQPTKSEQAYQQAIDFIETYRNHLDFLPHIYDELANLHFERGNYEVASNLFKKVMELDFEYFDSRSERNKYLLNIQDDFISYKEAEKTRQRKQELIQLQQQQKLWWFQKLLLVGSLFFLGLLGLVYIKLQKGKIKAEKALNHQLQKQNIEKEEFLEQIEKKNEELITFSNIMSHDLKAPLRTISAFSGLVKKQVQGNFKQEDLLKHINFITSSTESMEELIDDLLLYSKVSMNQDEFSKVDLNKLIVLVLPSFSYDINTGKAVVDVKHLPIINGNKGLLKTVFHNLISNAIKYQPKNQPDRQATIKIWMTEEAQQFNIFLQDNGIGIPKDYADKLFQPFVRFHAASAYKGTGLGMSICDRIMSHHQGSIQLEHTSPSGSCFKLTFPKVNQEDGSFNTSVSAKKMTPVQKMLSSI